jgi:hypothetical protein
MAKIVLRFAAKLLGPNDNQVEFNRALLQRYRAKFGLTPSVLEQPPKRVLRLAALEPGVPNTRGVKEHEPYDPNGVHRVETRCVRVCEAREGIEIEVRDIEEQRRASKDE